MIEAYERSTPRVIKAVTVALNLVPTSTYTSLTCSSLAFPILHLRRQSCNCFVVSRRAATVSCTLDPIYMFDKGQIKRTHISFPMSNTASTYVGAIRPVFRTSGVNGGRDVHIFRHDCYGNLSPSLTLTTIFEPGSRDGDCTEVYESRKRGFFSRRAWRTTVKRK